MINRSRKTHLKNIIKKLVDWKLIGEVSSKTKDGQQYQSRRVQLELVDVKGNEQRWNCSIKNAQKCIGLLKQGLIVRIFKDGSDQFSKWQVMPSEA